MTDHAGDQTLARSSAFPAEFRQHAGGEKPTGYGGAAGGAKEAHGPIRRATCPSAPWGVAFIETSQLHGDLSQWGNEWHFSPNSHNI